ncbi:Uncharacterised protein [Salmonella enterica subsp. enterica serovar Typhimurium str. DT104]|nr:Uncharacterised protein [Salmonella enterica subsp. enterica serovar Typhimurium str. DT104]
MGVSKNNRPAQVAFTEHQPDKSPSGQRRQGEQAAGKHRVMRILITGFRHRGDKFLPGVLLNAHPHLFTQWNVLIPGLLKLPAPVAAMQDIIQRCYRFNHQKMADWRGCGRSNLPLIDKPEFGKELNRIFARTAGDALNAFLAGNRLQGHRH